MTDLIERLQDGRQHAISQVEYEYFLDALPPVCLTTHYRQQLWDFGFAEGADYVYLFRRRGDQYFAVKTPYLNPYEAGGFDMQKHRQVLKWIDTAKRNPAFRQAGSPHIDTQTFHEYENDEDLLADAQLDDWRGGQALFIGSLCFVKLSTDGDEWLAIKSDTALGRMSFRRLVEAGGVDAGQSYLDTLWAAPAVAPALGHKRRQR